MCQIWPDFYVVWSLFPDFWGQGVHFWGQKAKILKKNLTNDRVENFAKLNEKTAYKAF